MPPEPTRATTPTPLEMVEQVVDLSVGGVAALMPALLLAMPGVVLLLTVPFGRAEDHGWLVQFDEARLDELISSAAPAARETAIYVYGERGWQVSSAAEAADATYYDVHRDPGPPADRAMAARAVACVAMRFD